MEKCASTSFKEGGTLLIGQGLFILESIRAARCLSSADPKEFLMNTAGKAFFFHL